jgi:DNA-binding GntR family transcriptional regulator
VGETYELREAFEVMAVRRILEHGRNVSALWAPCREMDRAAAAGATARRWWRPTRRSTAR